MGLSPKFMMDFENNIPTWFSSTLLSACALVLLLISAVHRRQQPLHVSFGLLAFVFLLLSIDEAASFHEILYKPLNRLPGADGILHFAWVVPGALFAPSVAAWSWKSLRQLPAAVRMRFLRAGAVY